MTKINPNPKNNFFSSYKHHTIMKKLDIRHLIIALFLFLFLGTCYQANGQSMDSIFIKSPVLCPPAEMYGEMTDEDVAKELATVHGVHIPIRQIKVFRACPVASAPVTHPRFFAPRGWEYSQEKNRYIKK